MHNGLTAMPPFCCLLSRYKSNKDLCLMNQIHICHSEVFTSASFKQTQEDSCLPPPLRTSYIFLLNINFKKGFYCFTQRVVLSLCLAGADFLSWGPKHVRMWGLKSVTSQERGWALQLNVDLAQDLGPAVLCGNAIVHSSCFVVNWF